ncbi:MAG: hypothetical protein JKX98_11000 [Alcanivoracaceae bacterium]|nr:hypothetical protein [Alcanivoracaceae bacterium]
MIYNNAKELHLTYKALSKLMLAFNLDFNVFYKTLREHYVLDIYQVSQSVTRTALKSGIDRRFISAIIKNKKQYHKTSSLLMIVKEIKTRAHNNAMLIAKKGEDSIESIIRELANGSTTLKTVLDELSETGYINDMGEKIKYLGKPTAKTAENHKKLKIFSVQLNELVKTLTKNSKHQNYLDA